MDVRFGNYEQFLDFFRKAPRNVQNILYKAYPDFAARMTNDYINSIKKVKGVANNVKDAVKENVKAITAKPKATSTLNKNLDSAFDTLYGKGKETAKTASKATKAASKIKVPNILKGAGGFYAKRIAPIQGAINLFSGNSDLTDRLGGLGMIGTGLAATAGVTGAAPLAGAFIVGDMLKKNVSVPVGEKIGDWIYKPSSIYYNPNVPTRIDITQAPNGKPYTPEELEKIIAYNDKVDAKIAAQYGQAMTPYGATAQQAQVEPETTNTVGQIPSNYSNPVPSQPRTQSGMGVTPQSFQNGQQGGVNSKQDNLYLNNISQALNPIVEPVNYSNEYLMKANDISNKLQGVQGEQMNNDINPYSQLRGYADVNNQLVPIPNQPQNIREDVLPEYLQVMEGIRGKQGELNYTDILNKYNAAMEADRQRNALNTLANMNNIQTQKAPIYYIGSQGDLRALEQDQTGIRPMLPTNTSSNTDKLLGQLKIQQAQQADALAQQKAYQDILKAQQEREDMIAQATALAEQFGGRPEMYMNKDIVQSLLSQTINPNIQAQANVMEAIGKAPTQDQLKAAEQYRTIAGKLDEVQLGKQFDTQIAQINNQARLIQTQLEQSGMDRRMAAQIASQEALNQYTQLMQNTRAMMEDQRARDLAEYSRGTQESVANIYANARGGSGKQPVTQEDLYNQLVIEGAKSGIPIPQLIKYADLLGTNRGLTSAEDAELNR